MTLSARSSSRGGAPERWLVVEVPTPRGEDEAALVIDELAAAAGRGVEERDGRIVAYLPAPDDGGERILTELRERLEPVLGAEAGEIAHHLQPHEDWERIWKEGLSARRVTPRIVVSPTWETPHLEPGDVLISIDPGMAFGTAEHPTTRGALRLMDARIEPGDRIADVGAGSGILAIAAILLGADRVIAVEMDGWSCATAEQNSTANGVADRVEIRHEAAGPDLFSDEPPFDGIVANIEWSLLTSLLPALASGLREGAWLILGGVLEHEVDDLLRDAGEVGLTLLEEDREEQWWTGRFTYRVAGPPSSA